METYIMSILKRFNLSYSSWSLYKESQFRFFHQYILKTPSTEETLNVYGDAGNVVHEALEDYIVSKLYSFDEHWNEYNIDNKPGFGGKKLDFASYKDMYIYGLTITENFTTNVVPELEIQREFYGINCKGFIDVYDGDGRDIIISDWKTNSKHSYNLHRDQRLFYSWLIWKCNGTIPLCQWHYLKDKKVHEDMFTLEQIEEFDNEIKTFLNEIQLKGDDPSKYEIGDWKSPFNQYKTLCIEEIERRKETDTREITLAIKGSYVFFEGDVDYKLEQGIDFATKFDLPDKHFMQNMIRNNATGIVNVQDVGTIHLYNKRHKCFPIGLLNKVNQVIDDYADHYKKRISVHTIDYRDKKVMDWTSEDMPDKLRTNKELRDYQNDAVNIFMEKKYGIINIATGGGKTFTAAEIIRRVDGRTLWIIDRKELLEQTKKELESLLDTKIGVISAGKVEIENITIATVQTLKSKVQELSEYLNSVNFCIVDEFHKAAAESYVKIFSRLNNNKYRLGLTATVKRDDGKTPILHGILGETIYTMSTKDLIDMGYLVKPKIEFIEIGLPQMFKETYAEDYEENIVFNDKRNHRIRDEAVDNKKILILTKQVEHGEHISNLINNSQHIHGKTPKKKREQIMQDFRDNKFNVLVMTHSIGSEGLDIPNLDIIINAAANKGDVKSIQILGRVLRSFKGKTEARYVDFVDTGKHTYKHSQARMKAFKEQGHEVRIIK